MQKEIHKNFRLSDFKCYFCHKPEPVLHWYDNNEVRANTNRTYCGGREKKQKDALNNEQ